MYIDDIIVAFSALELATGNPVAQVREDIGKAGLTLNVQKSCFSPSQQGVWLGFVLDFEKGKIHIEEEKMVALIDSIDGLLASHQMVQVRTLASVVGQIISMSWAIGYIARLFTRHLYATVSRRFSWNSYMLLDVRSKAELEFWKANIHHLNGHSMWFASSAVRIAYSDASGLGYGGFAVEHADKIVHGQWTLEEQYKSSTWREVVAVRKVLVEIALLLAGLCVKWCSDNRMWCIFCNPEVERGMKPLLFLAFVKNIPSV